MPGPTADEPSTRQPQRAYSDSQALMLDEGSRRAKADKILAVLLHWTGREDLTGLVVADVGCSGGTIAARLRQAGADVVGLDIDEPGIGKAASRYGGVGGPAFVCADSMAVPLADASVDVVVCNHIYEHVVSPEALVAELRRVVRPDGVVYLGLGNRWGIVEPHYRLPFLSYLPRHLADRYVRLSGRAQTYYEQFRTRSGLVELLAPFSVWDYTHTVLSEPDRFAMGGGPASRAPGLLWRASVALRPVVPTFIWLGTPGEARPRGGPLRRDPARVRRAQPPAAVR